MKKNFGDDNITKTNNLSVDLWEKYAEMGMHDEKIKKIVYLLNDNREDLINDYKKISSVILNVENSQITSRFSDFLNHRISELIKLENISINHELLIEVIARFKVELLNYLLERKNHIYLCEIKFRDGYSLFKVFKALRKSHDKINFRILCNEIHAYVTNDSKTYLIDIILNTDNSQFFLKKQVNLLVNLDRLLKCLECNRSENFTTNIRFKEDSLEIEQYSLTLKSIISRTINDVKVNFERENILDELTELNYIGCCTLNKEKFFHIISQAGRFSEGIKIELSRDSIHLFDNDNKGNTIIRWEKKEIHEIKINSQNIEEAIKIYISIINLKKIIPFLFEDNPLLKLYFNKEIPIKVRTDFKTLEKSFGLIFIAQRDASAYD